MAEKNADYKSLILNTLEKNERLKQVELSELVKKQINYFANTKVDFSKYSKTTYSYHLKKLLKFKKIKSEKTEHGIYFYIQKSDHQIPGGLLLKELGVRINCPEVLMNTGIQITQDIPLSIDKRFYTLIFQFNSRNFCLKIPMNLSPFKIHLSRKSYEEEIFKEVNYNFEGRTITIELPILKMSRYKIGPELKENKTGHALISFDDNEIITTDLGATNPLRIAVIKKMNLEIFLNEISLLSDLTVDAKALGLPTKIVDKLQIESKQSVQLSQPSLLLLSEDAQLAIF